MVTTHAGMNRVQRAGRDLVAALNQFDVPEAEQNELLGALGVMKPDIVGI